MKTIEKINGVTAKIEVEKNCQKKRFKTFETIEDMVNYMTNNDVIYTGANIGNDFFTIQLEKTDQADENWYENEMDIENNTFPKSDLPTNMFK